MFSLSSSSPALKISALAGLLSVASCGGGDQGNVPGSLSGPGQGGTGNIAPATGGSGAGGVAPGGCQVHFVFTTLNNGGRFGPRNVSAVWVTDAQGTFVRTVEENGFIRQRDLTKWEQASRGSTVDAITGATNAAPRTHDVVWDCADSSGAQMAAGNYTMNAEFTTDNTGGFFPIGTAPYLSVPFQLGAGPVALTPADEQYFTGISLTVE